LRIKRGKLGEDDLVIFMLEKECRKIANEKNITIKDREIGIHVYWKDGSWYRRFKIFDTWQEVYDFLIEQGDKLKW
jgi:hypothetical protein